MPSASATAGNITHSKRLISSVSGVTPSSTVWLRSKAKISRLLRDNAFLETRTPRKPSTPLPHEVVEMIIAHLIYDLRALKACSLTCLSWYIAAVPHLHHTITFREKIIFITHSRLRPLSKLHGLGIIPLVREVRVLCSLDERPWFKSRAFSRQDLRYFSAFANVQKLRLEKVDISSFIPKVGRYFGQFSTTLRSIALIAPCCYTPRELSYFLSLFSNLDDIEIRYLFSPSLLPNPPIPDTELVPISAPKLRGQLVAGWFCEVETWSALITWCGGLGFHSMTLYEVADCAPLLLDACSETLETLRFFAEGSSWCFPRPLLPNIDLSRLKVLRSLQVEIHMIPLGRGDNSRNVLVEVFSTITSPSFSELVIILEDRNASEAYNLPSHVTLFQILRAMHDVRPFNLVFLLMPYLFKRRYRQVLVEGLSLATAKGFLDFLDSPPAIWDKFPDFEV